MLSLRDRKKTVIRKGNPTKTDEQFLLINISHQ